MNHATKYAKGVNCDVSQIVEINSQRRKAVFLQPCPSHSPACPNPPFEEVRGSKKLQDTEEEACGHSGHSYQTPFRSPLPNAKSSTSCSREHVFLSAADYLDTLHAWKIFKTIAQ